MSEASEISFTTFANRRDHSLASSYVARSFAPLLEDVVAPLEELSSNGSGDGVAAFLFHFCSRLLMVTR
jgi:hypothetical protein